MPQKAKPHDWWINSNWFGTKDSDKLFSALFVRVFATVYVCVCERREWNVSARQSMAWRPFVGSAFFGRNILLGKRPILVGLFHKRNLMNWQFIETTNFLMAVFKVKWSEIAAKYLTSKYMPAATGSDSPSLGHRVFGKNADVSVKRNMGNLLSSGYGYWCRQGCGLGTWRYKDVWTAADDVHGTGKNKRK